MDISSLHSVGEDEISFNVCGTVDAIHQSPELDIEFPKNHVVRTQITEGFRAKSTVEIDFYVGEIDGILIWTNKLSPQDIKVLKFGPTTFFYGMKVKYRLNMIKRKISLD